MAKKCAGSGLLLMQLQLAFQREGVQELYDVLCEEINNKPCVTKTKVVTAKFAMPLVTLTGKDVPFVWDAGCSTAFSALRASLIHAPILAFPTETGQYILDTDASNFGLGGVLSQIQDDVKRVVAYCSRALRPSQRRYYTTKREMLAAVAMCIHFRSYLRGAKFTLRMDHKSLVWLHRFKDT